MCDIGGGPEDIHPAVAYRLSRTNVGNVHTVPRQRPNPPEICGRGRNRRHVGLSSREREELESVANMRRLSKLAFLDSTVADMFHTLPIGATRAGDAGHDEATFLRDFASKKGSLCDLDGLGRLRVPDFLRDQRDRAVMLKKSSDD